jgi:poly(3-hydroxybutyrate) depolymerase
MLYQAYHATTAAFQPWRMAARLALAGGASLGPCDTSCAQRSATALLEVASRTMVTHERPAYGIDHAEVGNRKVPVWEEIALSLPFCDLIHFAKDSATPQPKLLLIAPLSGHFATILRHTVETALRDHDVYITDWKNARDVPLSAGPFGFDDFIDYIIKCLHAIGPGAHVLAVCQPCVQALAAVAVMSEDKDKALPRSLTLMAGPVDVRINPTAVNDLANSHDISWFEENLIHPVPYGLKGAGRKVYPGFVQLAAFMSMNQERHLNAHREMYEHLAHGRRDDAQSIMTFYDEYFAVIDLAAEFYIETVERVFQNAELARGELTYRGRKVDPGAIRRTALLTIEGERDDICAVGQTAAAHDLCKNLRPHLKQHHLQPGVGHYGTFSGKKWNSQIYPVVKSLVLATN